MITTGFILQCSVCKKDIFVGEVFGKEFRYYENPEITGNIVGVSEGTADTFICIKCHIKWRCPECLQIRVDDERVKNGMKCSFCAYGNEELERRKK